MSAEEHGPGPGETPAGGQDNASSDAEPQSENPSENPSGNQSETNPQAGNVIRALGEQTTARQAKQPSGRADDVPGDLPALPGQNSDLTDTGVALNAGSTEVAVAGGVGESQRALSVASARGFRVKMLRWRRQLSEITALEPILMAESEMLLRKRSLALRYRAMAGERLGSLLPEGYALIREAGRRALKMRHYDVQIVGGISLFEGCVAEMQTGEGKTLTATLPLYLHSLLGKGAHLATVNDYLAHRDAEWMRPLFELLGLTVGVIQTSDDQTSRRKSYGADVTYGTAKEFGFDFLRDRLLLRAQNRVETEMLGDGGGGFSGSGDQIVMRPDRIIVGEVRAGECLDMLQAMNTGHDGSLTTAHANSPRDAISRLSTMVLMSGMELPSSAIREQIVSAIDLIIHVRRFEDGIRRVESVDELVGLEGNTPQLQQIFRFDVTGRKGKRLQGKHVATGTVPRLVEKLRARSIDIPTSWFEKETGPTR
ncbi:ATPase, T2SS/T4P/T4SS family [bacterium]|nr:ATPase, T2SS/T4P/T4SS family [bacterium]